MVSPFFPRFVFVCLCTALRLAAEDAAELERRKPVYAQRSVFSTASSQVIGHHDSRI